MKELVVALVAIVGIAMIGVGAFMAGRSSVDQTLYCGAYTHKWDNLNGCEILPGYTVVKGGS
jgi:hypothetical protein